MKAKYILLLLAFLAFRMAYPQDSSGYKSVGNNWKITSQDIMFSISEGDDRFKYYYPGR